MLELKAAKRRHVHQLDGPFSCIPVGETKIGLIPTRLEPLMTNQLQGDPEIEDQD